MNGTVEDYIRELEGRLAEARDAADEAIAEVERLRQVLLAIYKQIDIALAPGEISQ